MYVCDRGGGGQEDGRQEALAKGGIVEEAPWFLLSLLITWTPKSLPFQVVITQ